MTAVAQVKLYSEAAQSDSAIYFSPVRTAPCSRPGIVYGEEKGQLQGLPLQRRNARPLLSACLSLLFSVIIIDAMI